MRELIAKNPKQLDICLRLLYAERVHFIVNVRETSKKKIVYSIAVEANAQMMADIEEKYRILTS